MRIRFLYGNEDVEKAVADKKRMTDSSCVLWHIMSCALLVIPRLVLCLCVSLWLVHCIVSRDSMASCVLLLFRHVVSFVRLCGLVCERTVWWVLENMLLEVNDAGPDAAPLTTEEIEKRKKMDEEVCFISLENWRETTLGLGLLVRPRTMRERVKKLIPVLELVEDYVSSESYNMGVRYALPLRRQQRNTARPQQQGISNTNQ